VTGMYIAIGIVIVIIALVTVGTWFVLRSE